MMKRLALSIGALCLFTSLTALAVDVAQVQKDLAGGGAKGWIHGAVHARGLYVFTVRSPKDFFDYIEMSLIPANDDVEAKLATLGRHDKVLVKGEFMPNPSPQKHISATSVEVLEKFDSKIPTEDYQYEAKIPDELQHISNAQFLVHAIAADGHILVVEYKDQVLPIFVKNNELTKELYRNDVVRLEFKIQKHPNQPSHLRVDEKSASAVKVIDSIKALNGKPAVVEGALIMFPKSPEIMFNVFAVQQTLTSSLKRQYTLVNFDDTAEFAKIRKVLQDAWDRHPGQFKNGRNKLISTKIQVKVTGTFNEIDPNQANPQVLLKSANSIVIEE